MSTTMVEQPQRQALAVPPDSSAVAGPPTTSGTDRQPSDQRVIDAASTMTEPMDVDEEAPEGQTIVVNGTARATSPVDVSSLGGSETARLLLERNKRRLEIQMQFVENARRKIQNETHPDMMERLRVLAKDRDRLLQVAEQRSEYFQRGTAVIFDYECDEANSEFDLHCEKLRQDMLEEIQHELEILQDQRKGGHSSGTPPINGSDSSSSSSFPLDTAQKIKKRAGYVFQPLESKLAQSEVDHDVRELTGFYETSKKRRMEFDTGTEPLAYGEATPIAKYHRNKLLYRDWIFQQGDEVYVLNYTASSEYVAIICAITSTEVLVLSEKGKYYRLVIMDIRQGRVVLTTLSAEQAAARDDGGDASP
ncbi:hypothetical protein BBJ28_00011474 [Nothophytophthora sp. Chile5]|nr:hypothetical protein BBJ28_00011474 [Nothophytophthora sp. Chile5]